jgi:hypothetical protein
MVAAPRRLPAIAAAIHEPKTGTSKLPISREGLGRGCVLARLVVLGHDNLLPGEL